jgi:hypothetical protein
MGSLPRKVLVEVYGLELDEQNEAVGDIPPNGDRERAISLAESGNPYIDEIVEGGPTYTERSLMSVHLERLDPRSGEPVWTSPELVVDGALVNAPKIVSAVGSVL